MNFTASPSKSADATERWEAATSLSKSLALSDLDKDGNPQDNDPDFDEDKEDPDHIIGMTEGDKGDRLFLVAWPEPKVREGEMKKETKCKLYNAEYVYKKWPQLAITFFESKLVFCPPKGSKKKMSVKE